jgi:hypothetical protein
LDFKVPITVQRFVVVDGFVVFVLAVVAALMGL